MKIAHRTYRLHEIKHETSLSLANLIELFTSDEHIFPGQRNHAKGVLHKQHVRGQLKGDSRRFSLVYVRALKKLMGLDGYHRIAALTTPAGDGQNLAWFSDAEPFIALTYVVGTMAEAEQLFAQFNSLAAAKRATCWFDSALREAGVLDTIRSPLVTGHGKAFAVQLASGIRGSSRTKQATLAVMEGIKLVDSFQLRKQPHEFVGSLAAYLAVAQNCPHPKLAERFIRGVNQAVFEPETKEDWGIDIYHNFLVNNGTRTGQAANSVAFSRGLTAFSFFAYASRGKQLKLTGPVTTIGEFRRLMAAL